MQTRRFVYVTHVWTWFTYILDSSLHHSLQSSLYRSLSESTLHHGPNVCGFIYSVLLLP